ncbi:NDR1/HIN1-like protein 12 [Mercurialis annua]|uniref:NDR1/HIN1-like protein 12 n=1 Tax=Mercurialis annua TaxID=3986 RepID=UPI0021601C71|nr:NDR1/HIN1-like protein 12 [Mercurialis annua]
MEEGRKPEETHQTQPKMIHDHEKEHHKHKHTAPQSSYYPRDPRRTFCTVITVFLLLAGLSVLIVWLIYRPHKPHFTVVNAAVYDLNTSSPPFISTSMQFTLVTRNPNKRVSIIYDKLSAYVSYRNQAITPTVVLPPLYHEKKSTVAVSPVLGGAQVPVSVEVANGLVMDENYGVVVLRVVLLGRLRWKAGAIKTGRYGVYVKCDVWVGLKRGFVGPVPLLGSPQCKVDI